MSLLAWLLALQLYGVPVRHSSRRSGASVTAHAESRRLLLEAQSRAMKEANVDYFEGVVADYLGPIALCSSTLSAASN
jgi:hypothetical protein